MISAPVAVLLSPVDGEALDAYLERVARANNHDCASLVRLLDAQPGALTRLAIDPPISLLNGLERLVGQPGGVLESMTLRSLPGLDLAAADSTDRSTWRPKRARGWSPQVGTAVCPMCFASDRIWRLIWRTPYTTVCLKHGVYLVGWCPQCERPFRSQRTSVAGQGDPEVCNTTAPGRGHCGLKLDTLPTEPALAVDVAAQQRIQAAINGHDVDMLGALASPEVYVPELWALTVLLLRLGITPSAERVVPWAEAARADQRRGAGTNSARWRAMPPEDSRLRSVALSSADQILGRPSVQAAAVDLQPWIDLAPRGSGRQATFLALNTTPTPLLTQIVLAAAANAATGSTLAALLSLPGQGPLSPDRIPHLIDDDLHRALFGDAMDVTPPTAREFVSICLARRATKAPTWEAAAEALQIDPTHGPKAARACGTRLLWPRQRFVEAIDDAAAVLAEADVDYRHREDIVRQLNAAIGWHESWRRHYRPHSERASKYLAVTWLWVNWAGGRFVDSPGWITPPTAGHLGYYRRFDDHLAPGAGQALIAIATDRAGDDYERHQ